MQITMRAGSPERARVGTVAVGAFADGTLAAPAQAIDRASKKRLSAVLKRGDLDAKAGATLLLHDVPGVMADRVLLVGLGVRDAFGDKAFRDAVTGAARVFAAGPSKDAALTLSVEVRGRSLEWRARQASRILANAGYRFDAPRAKKPKERGARSITLLVADRVTPELTSAVRQGRAIAEGMALAKDLGNLGGNVCTPAYLADTARALGKEFKFKVEVLERADMEKLGMESALSVDALPTIRASSLSCTTGEAGRRPGRSCSWARASRSTPAASRSSPATTST